MLEVIGAGFGRTGTMSLKVALEQLGFDPCYHMVECMPRGPGHWRLWEEAVRGADHWDAIFEGFRAAVDFPACASYAALVERYPESKVVLTIRDPERWFRSTQETIFAPRWMQYLQSSAEMGSFVRATVNDVFDGRMHDRDHLVRCYAEHIEAVQRTVPAERLLVFEVAQGWEPLCAFLDRPVPDGPFPSVNDTAATIEIIDKIIAEGFERAFGAR